MTANSAGSHVYRWALIGAIVLIAVIAVLPRLFGGGDRNNVVANAAKKIDEARKEMTASLQAQNKAMDAKKHELKVIQSDPDERRRLKRLAEFANRRRQG